MQNIRRCVIQLRAKISTPSWPPPTRFFATIITLINWRSLTSWRNHQQSRRRTASGHVTTIITNFVCLRGWRWRLRIKEINSAEQSPKQVRIHSFPQTNCNKYPNIVALSAATSHGNKYLPNTAAGTRLRVWKPFLRKPIGERLISSSWFHFISGADTSLQVQDPAYSALNAPPNFFLGPPTFTLSDPFLVSCAHKVKLLGKFS